MQRHSRIGIASFVTSIAVGSVLLVTLIIAMVMVASSPGGINSRSLVVAVLGLSMIACLFGNLIALGLGIAGLCQRDRA